MSFAVKAFVTRHLGVEFTHVPEFDMNQCFADSSSVKPIILVLFPGCDPLSPVLNFMPETEGMINKVTRQKIFSVDKFVHLWWVTDDCVTVTITGQVPDNANVYLLLN